MIFAWNADLLDAALTGLTLKQKLALDLVSSTASTMNPGPVRLKQAGFKDADDYATVLESARAHVKRHFAVMGIHHVHDLEFQGPQTSAEGRLRDRHIRATRNELRGTAGADTRRDF